MPSKTPTAKVINPNHEELSRLLAADHPREIIALLEKLGLVDEPADFIQINVPMIGEGDFRAYSYDGKIVITGSPDNFGTVLVKEMHEELFKF